MNTKNEKGWVLAGGIAGTLPLIILFFISITCYQGTTCPQLPSFVLNIINIIENIVADNLIFSLIFLAPLFLLLSLFTYWAKDEVFLAWFNFAKWFVPIIIIASIWLETKGGGGGGFGISSGMDSFIILGLLYTIFITTSLVKIVRVYLRTRGK